MALRQSALQLPLAGIWLVQVAAFACASGMRLSRLRSLFGSVNARQIANLLERTPSHRLLKGEERSISIMFVDMRGFSTFSRNCPPQAVIRLLNTYFAAIVPVIERNGGTVNRYIGDGVLVLFNAPQTLEDHAVRAVRAAVEMVETVHSMKSTWEALVFPDLRISVGINTGHVVVALVGSPQRLDYTAHGDAVNAAARIETENRKQGTEILIAAATWRLLTPEERDCLHCSPSPMFVEVKGVGTVEIHAVDVPKQSS
jgi:adenylate cyclase